jgi:heme/copper-type cytochrome/quinol oxidase subunit 3
MTPEHRSSVDVSGLPTTTFGYRNVVWWSTVAFMAIEGTSLALCAVTYLYLVRSHPTLPPARTPPPALTRATLEVALMLVSFVPATLLTRAGTRKDLPALRVWIAVTLLFNLAFVLLRYLELGDLHVRWDSNAYGSAAWLVMLTHGSLLAVEVGELGIVGAMAWTGRWEDKHFSDACDVAFYWYFMVLSWLPLYAMVFLLPRMV